MLGGAASRLRDVGLLRDFDERRGQFHRRDHDACALARPRGEFEILRQATGAAQPEPEAVARREAVLEREIHVGDSRSLVLEGQSQSAFAVVDDRLHQQRAAAAVHQRVACQLARRGHELRLIDQAEPEAHRPIANPLTHADDVVVGANRQRIMLLDVHPPSLSRVGLG